MSSGDFDSGTDPEEANSSSSLSALLSDNPPQSENLVPVINVEDSEETENDLDSDLKENRNTPVYQTFLTEVYTFNSIYTTPASITKFRRSTPISNLTSDPLILLDPCQKELIFLNMPDQGSSSPFTYMVRGVGAMSTLLVSEDGTPHFPLFWSLEPRRVPGFDYEDLSFDEKIDVAFLRNSAPLDYKMPPKATVPRTLVNEKAMRRWLKEAGGEPDGQNTGGNVNQPMVSTNERRKKQKLDVQGENQSKPTTTEAGPTKPAVQNVPPQQPTTKTTSIPTQTGAHTSSGAQGQAGSSSLPLLGDKWWTLFNNFEGAEGSEVNSIFDHRFNVERVVSREFNKKEDRTRVNKVGMHSGMSSANKELKERAHKIEELTEKLKALESSAQTINSLEKSLCEYKNKLTSAENDKKAAENDKKTTETKYNGLNTKYSDIVAQQVQLKKDLVAAINEKNKACEDLLAVTEQKNQLKVDLKALQTEIAIQHARGFSKAIDQVKILNPAANVEDVGVFKKIVEGKIVDESGDEDE
ncbi:hypothetical protein SESBI_26287 [Sesbania bispinosa]|nr:hypothetical protein SESBI_26287 [Sesbania bispinosa]